MPFKTILLKPREPKPSLGRRLVRKFRSIRGLDWKRMEEARVFLNPKRKEVKELRETLLSEASDRILSYPNSKKLERIISDAGGELSALELEARRAKDRNFLQELMAKSVDQVAIRSRAQKQLVVHLTHFRDQEFHSLARGKSALIASDCLSLSSSEKRKVELLGNVIPVVDRLAKKTSGQKDLNRVIRENGLNLLSPFLGKRRASKFLSVYYRVYSNLVRPSG